MSDFFQFLTLSLVSISCGVLSPFLVLKKMTMFANSISHTALLGIALCFMLLGSYSLNITTLFISSLLSALLTAFFTWGLMKIFRLQEDASIGLVFSSLFALGIVLVTLYMKNVHLGIESVMGNVDILQEQDVKLCTFLALCNLSFVGLFYLRLKLMSFDMNLAKGLGIKTNILHFCLLFFTAASCVSAFRSVGVLLVLAFLTGPFLTARLFSHRLHILLILTPLLGILASALAVLFSMGCFELFGLSVSTGGVGVIWIGLIYLFSKWVVSAKIDPCEKKLPS